MADATDDKPVVFLNSAGEEISNDPRWHARRILGEQGEQPDTEKDDIIAQLQAQLAAMQAQGLAPKTGAGDDDEIEGEPNYDLDDEGNRTYKELDTKELADLVKTREITIEGKKTAGAARAALIADDAAKREQASE